MLCTPLVSFYLFSKSIKLAVTAEKTEKESATLMTRKRNRILHQGFTFRFLCNTAFQVEAYDERSIATARQP